MTARHTWTVRYRRAAWTQRQARHYRSKRAALRLVAKLRSPTDLTPIVELWVERQTLGPVEVVWRLEEEDLR